MFIRLFFWIWSLSLHYLLKPYANLLVSGELQERLGSEWNSFRNNLIRGRNEAEELLNLVHSRYEMFNKSNFQFFLVSSNIPAHSWDILKYKFACKIIHPGSSFVMIFGGSSVTAGHDNLLSQSYPAVVTRRLTPVFNAMGVNLTTYNIAQRANNCRPYDYCYEAMGVEGADWFGWEQSYNCGREQGYFELLARLAGWNKGVVYYSASGGITASECTPSTDPVPWISEAWTPSQVIPPLSRYLPNISEIRALRMELDMWNKDGSSVDRFTKPLSDPAYKGVGAHGFNMWASSRSLCLHPSGKRGCTGADVRGACFSNGGPHWLTSETAQYGHVYGRKPASHHPSAGFHMLRGEAIAWLYSAILLDAIYEIEEQHDKLSKIYDSDSQVRTKLLEVFRSELESRQPPLPAPKTCGNACLHRPTCYTSFLPHYNPARTLEAAMLNLVESGWTRKEPWNHNTHEEYLDFKPYYESSGPNRPLQLLLNISHEASDVMVCGAGYKDSVKHAALSVDFNRSPSSHTLYPSRRELGDDCVQLEGVPHGVHVLSVSQNGSHPILVSHLLIL